MILAGSKDNPGFVIKNNVYVGSTGILVTGNLIRNYSYVNKTKLVEITATPLPAYSLTGSGNYASLVYETCHGINYSSAANAGKTGNYNFYMAPYGPGYYQPPVGELPTIAEQTFGFSKVSKKQTDDLNLADYLKIFGLRITSKINKFIPCKNYNLTAFHEGITDCPITSQPAFKYSEIQAELAAGTYLGSVGGDIYNHNPIPSSYDRGVLVATTLYKSANPEGAKKTNENQDLCFYVTGQDLRPIPSFSRGSSASSSNYVFGKCANLSEIDRQPLAVGAVDGHTNASVGNPKDIISDGDLGQDTSNYDQSIYWNFIFKYNHESLPFVNTHEAGTMTQDNDQVREDHWWEHRECPENIDYLNHAFGNNINACPMNYVDVPYYAAIGKFGYFGTRFQDTWRKITNEFDETTGWIPVFNILGSTRAGGLGAKTVLDQRYVKSPEDNMLYRAVLSASGIANIISAKIQIECTGDGYSWNGDLDQCDYAYPFSFSTQIPQAYFHSGEEPSIESSYLGESGFLLLTDKDTFFPFVPPTGGVPGSIFLENSGVRSFLFNLSPSLYGSEDVGAWALTGELFDNLDLTLQVFQKKKYIDYPYEPTGSVIYQLKEDSEYYPHSQGIGARHYDSLVSAASVEKKYYDFAFSDRVLFLRLNYELSKTSTQYAYLINNIRDFKNLYLGLCTGVVGAGFSSTSVGEFKISYINQGSSFIPVDDPLYSFTNSYITTGNYNPNDLIQFNEFVKKYGVFKLINDSSADTAWYDKITNEKRIRIAKSYYGNIAGGNPVDIFPNNQIAFSFEKTQDFAASDFIKYGAVVNSVQSNGKTLPEVKRQYFSAGFSTIFEASGYAQYSNHKVSNDTINDIPIKTSLFEYGVSKFGFPKVTSTVQNSFTASRYNFYLGYINPRGCGDENFITDTNSYLELINLPNVGMWKNYAPEKSPPPASPIGSPSRSPWPDAGFNRVGKVKKNFSCFSPIFLQQPLNEAVKLCQAPKFRVYAVDYHSISEDKIIENRQGGGSAYPEVAYWLRKIKAINAKGDNLYPLAYQWFRVPKSKATEYLQTKNASLLQVSDPKGSWCCAEDGAGNSPECTVIRPKECVDINGVAISSWSHSEDSVLRFMGVKDSDATYYYFCTVAGRFGFRDSEFASATIDKQVKVQVSTLNLCGAGSATLSVAGLSINLPLQNGFLPDETVYFEQVKDTIWNDGNNCETVRFVGPEKLRGVTRVYTPGTFVDPRGKRVRSAHWKDFGALASASFTLSEASATKLYADRSLPYCDRSSHFLYAGVPMLLQGYIHRTHYEPAVLTENTSFGVKANKLRSVAELYPPRRYLTASPIPDWDNKNPGHHQFEANLGSIKKYSKNTAENLKVNNGPYGPVKNLEILPASVSNIISHAQDLMLKFNKAISLNASSKIITGPECGYVPPSLGRLMHFYVESFSTYYLLCEVGGVKPKKVRNWSFIAGGLRSAKAGLQYNWLGKPSDARLKRVSMPGPYAFQWKVERHNRDKSGNGMPLSFWSYNYEERIENLYDAAAVYGAVKKTSQYNGLSRQQRTLRRKMANTMFGPGSPIVTLRGTSIGPDDGLKLGCGSIRWKASGELGGDRPNGDFVKYMEQVAGVGPDPFSAYGCSGPYADDCFYPCLSLKYPEGFTPRGGKNLGYRNGTHRHYLTSSVSGPSNYSASVPGSPFTYRVFAIDLSPCSTNKKDVCNYLTPTAHIGIDTWPVANTSNTQPLITSISNL